MIYKLCLSFIFVIHWQYCVHGIVPDPKSKPRSPITVDLTNANLTNNEFFGTMQHNLQIREAEELILRGNKINKFVDCATHLNNLKILDLSYNRLTQFFFLCNEEYNLTSLNISHNQIEYLNDEALTHRVMKLKVLDVSYNDLFVVNDTMLQHMKNLEHLSLASNPINDNFDEYVFQNISNLKHLSLRNISATYFSSILFESLTNLEYLDLSENPIDELPVLPSSIKVLYIDGTKISHLGMMIMPHLRLLSLENSGNLTSVLINNFENLTQLEYLSMSDSRYLVEIRYKHMNIANLLPNLKTLSLKNCGLQGLSSALQPLIERTADVHLQNNPWNCDCHMQWINSIKKNNDLIYSFFKCHSPPQYRDKYLHDIPTEELICEKPGDWGRIFVTLLWICTVLVLFGLLVSLLVYLSRNCLGKWAMKLRHRGNDTVSYANVVNENDLVRILPDETTEHVEI